MKAKKALAVIGIVLIIGIMAVVFTACNNSTYQEKLKEAGYVITDISDIHLDIFISVAESSVYIFTLTK